MCLSFRSNYSLVALKVHELMIPMDSEAHYEVEVLKWDYTQRYPNPNNDVLSGLTDNTDPPDNPGTQPAPDRDSPFRADIGVSGDLTVKV